MIPFLSLYIHPSISPMIALTLFAFFSVHLSLALHFYLASSPNCSPHLSLAISPSWLELSSLPPRRITTHPQFSLIELQSLRTSLLRFNLFWPEWGACTPSSYHYIRRTGRHHHCRRDGLDLECNHPNAPQQRASNRIRGYGNGVEGWLRFQ